MDARDPVSRVQPTSAYAPQKNFRWVIVGFTVLFMLINFASRITMPLAAKPLISQFHLSPLQWGVIMSSFFWLFSIMGFLGGVVSDKTGIKGIFGTVSLLWGLAQFLVLAATGFGFLLFTRVLLGFSEGPSWSNAMKGVSGWLPKRERALGTGLAVAGVSLGPAISSPLLVAAMVAWGWQSAFLIMGVIAIMWSIAWWIWGGSSAARSRFVKADERDWIEQDKDDPKETGPDIPLGKLFLNGTYLSSVFGFWVFNYILFLVLTWLPDYLVTARHFTMAQMGLINSIPWLAAACGGLLGGILSSWIHRVTGSLRAARGYLLGACFLLIAVTFSLSAAVPSAALAVALISAAMFFNGIVNMGVNVAVHDFVPHNRMGLAQGLSNGIATTPGVIAPIITGYLVTVTHSFIIAFIIGGGLALIAAATSFFFMRPNAEVTHQAVASST